jgi:hypothetical protein
VRNDLARVIRERLGPAADPGSDRRDAFGLPIRLSQILQQRSNGRRGLVAMSANQSREAFLPLPECGERGGRGGCACGRPRCRRTGPWRRTSARSSAGACSSRGPAAGPRLPADVAAGGALHLAGVLWSGFPGSLRRCGSGRRARHRVSPGERPVALGAMQARRHGSEAKIAALRSAGLAGHSPPGWTSDPVKPAAIRGVIPCAMQHEVMRRVRDDPDGDACDRDHGNAGLGIRDACSTASA